MEFQLCDIFKNLYGVCVVSIWQEYIRNRYVQVNFVLKVVCISVTTYEKIFVWKRMK